MGQIISQFARGPYERRDVAAIQINVLQEPFAAEGLDVRAPGDVYKKLATKFNQMGDPNQSASDGWSKPATYDRIKTTGLMRVITAQGNCSLRTSVAEGTRCYDQGIAESYLQQASHYSTAVVCMAFDSIMIRTLLAVLLALVSLTAQTASVEGDREFTLSGNGSSDDDFNTTAVGASASLGYLTDCQEIGAPQGINVVEFEDADNRWNGVTRAFYNYQFDLAIAQPFVGANFDFEYGDVADESFIAGQEAGLPYLRKPDTFIQAMLEYQLPFDDVDEAEFIRSLGIGFNFK